jgi:hypothetical protein
MKKNKTTKFLFLLNDVEDNRTFQNAVSNSFIINKTEFVKKNGLLKFFLHLENFIKKEVITHVIIDTFLNFDYDYLFNIKKKFNFYLILLASDDSYDFNIITKQIACNFDFILTSCFLKKNYYKKKGIPSEFFIFPLKKKNNYKKKKYDISFIGNTYHKIERLEYLNILKKNQYKKKILINQNIDKKEMIKIIQESKINLNFTGSTYFFWFKFYKIDKYSFKFRIAEILSAQSFCLSQYELNTAKIFLEKKGVVYFKNKNDFLDKINFYLKNEKAREDIVKKIDNKIILKIDQKNFEKYFFQLIKKIKKNKSIVKYEYKDTLIHFFFKIRHLIKQILHFQSLDDILFILNRIIFIVRKSIL